MRHDTFRGENLHAIAICFHTLAAGGDVEMRFQVHTSTVEDGCLHRAIPSNYSQVFRPASERLLVFIFEPWLNGLREIPGTESQGILSSVWRHQEIYA